MIKVSILVPIFNVEKYLGKCLESLSNQTLREIEIICLNDGSTDNSLKIIEDFALHDQRFVIVNKENTGYGDTLNRGLEIAKGEYIAFVDSDDYVATCMYEQLYVRAKKEDADIAKGNYIEFFEYDNNEICKTKKITNKQTFYDGVFKPRTNKESFYFPMMNPLGIFKSEFLKCNKIRYNNTPGASHQDMGFWFQTFALAEKVVFVDEYFYYYRQNNPLSSINNRSNKYRCIFDEYEFILEKLKEKKVAGVEDVYCHRKYGSLMYFYDFLTIEAKEKFLNEIPYSFARDEREGFLNLTRFNNSEKSKLLSLCSNPFNLLIKELCTNLKSAQEKLDKYVLENNSLKNLIGRDDSIDQTANNIKVSVVMPVYNASATLGDAVKSVLGQSLIEFELICIDDGSTDNSCEIINNLFEDGRIRLIRNKHAGASSARNSGINKSRGKYIYFMDSDDILEPDALEKCLKAAEKNNLDLVSFNAETFYDESSLRKKFLGFERAYQRKLPDKTILGGEELFNLQIKIGGYSCCPWLLFSRRDFILRNKIFYKDGITYEDNLFTLEVYLKAHRCMHLNENLYKRRVRYGSSMTKEITQFNLFSYYKVFLGLLELSHLSSSVETDRNIQTLVAQVASTIVRQYKGIKNKDFSTYFTDSDIYLIKKLEQGKIFQTNPLISRRLMGNVTKTLHYWKENGTSETIKKVMEKL